MKTLDFKRNMTAASAFNKVMDDPSFWEGYIQGLGRHYHGGEFCTSEEHDDWMQLADKIGDG